MNKWKKNDQTNTTLNLTTNGKQWITYEMSYLLTCKWYI